ncbi:beta-ketoacyl-[acyl-carrier-protein] synthase family protein [Streptomyces gamaensis]|uniref:Beta-ketoacyl-[acyl-carrier-protein] synthase family protein n=1 Tax=Streptomyces gamaensis TaxID=1763542 RepID=A0ABW0YTV0_9ACTN
MSAVITGFGVFTAFGPGADALRAGVFAGKPGFAPVTRFDTSPFRGGHAAEYPGADPALPRVPSQWDVLLACGRSALGMAGLSDAERAPLLLGSQGDFTAVNRYWRAEAAGTALPSADELSVSVPGALADRLGETLGLGPRRVTFTNACVASATAVAQAAALVAAGRADVVVCAGAYVVDEEFFAKFDSGRAFASDGVVRPFARDRSGLLLGDGAAALVVESEEHARGRGAQALARVLGWGYSNDAFHLARPHPEGAGMASAIGRALERARVRPEQLGYVNAHGTGTPANDVAETRALRAALGTAAAGTPVSSTKSMTGHMLEASGIVEAVITLLALTDGILPPTANLDERDPECDLDYVANEPRAARIRRALSVNAAFGGANTALVLERP